MRRIALAAAGLLVALGVSIPAAHAQANSPQINTVQQFCWQVYFCINAWGGGPAVKVQGIGAGNNNFEVIYNSARGAYNIEFTGPGHYHGWCVGDYGDNPNNSTAGLVGGCGTVNIGWGGDFGISYANNGNEISFYSDHWGGYLDPEGTANGSLITMYSGTQDWYWIWPLA